MKIQQFKRIIKEDVEEQFRPLVEKVGYAFNSFADDVTNVLNNNISIEDNLNQAKKTVKVAVDSAGSPVGGLSIKTGLKRQCYGIQVLNVTNTTNSKSYPSGTPFLSFTESNGILTINNITNLSVNNNYTLNLILYS